MAPSTSLNGAGPKGSHACMNHGAGRKGSKEAFVSVPTDKVISGVFLTSDYHMPNV